MKESTPLVTTPDVFISCTIEDRPIADSLRDFLEANNIVCLMHPDDLQGNGKLTNIIMNAITEATVFILLVTPSSIQSLRVRKEVEFAVKLKKLQIHDTVESLKPWLYGDTNNFEYFLDIKPEIRLTSWSDPLPRTETNFWLLGKVNKLLTLS